MRRNSEAARVLALVGLSALAASSVVGCRGPMADRGMRWHDDYAFVASLPPITFHYDHGVLAGSYPEGVETIAIEYDDVSAELGHVCLCGAGGFRIAKEVCDTIRAGGQPLERGDFVLISGRDHTVGDVVASVLGCCRRANPETNQHLIDDSITAPRREYHYYVGYEPTETAVHVTYRKHLLIGHEAMDKLWKVELAFDREPDAVAAADVARYRETMLNMVQDVLLDRVPGLITIETIPYEQFDRRREAVAGALGD